MLVCWWGPFSRLRRPERLGSQVVLLIADSMLTGPDKLDKNKAKNPYP